MDKIFTNYPKHLKIKFQKPEDNIRYQIHETV